MKLKSALRYYDIFKTCPLSDASKFAQYTDDINHGIEHDDFTEVYEGFIDNLLALSVVEGLTLNLDELVKYYFPADEREEVKHERSTVIHLNSYARRRLAKHESKHESIVDIVAKLTNSEIDLNFFQHYEISTIIDILNRKQKIERRYNVKR